MTTIRDLEIRLAAVEAQLAAMPTCTCASCERQRCQRADDQRRAEAKRIVAIADAAEREAALLALAHIDRLQLLAQLTAPALAELVAGFAYEAAVRVLADAPGAVADAAIIAANPAAKRWRLSTEPGMMWRSTWRRLPASRLQELRDRGIGQWLDDAAAGWAADGAPQIGWIGVRVDHALGPIVVTDQQLVAMREVDPDLEAAIGAGVVCLSAVDDHESRVLTAMEHRLSGKRPCLARSEHA